MQITSDLEMVLDLPDKYLRSETPQGSGGGMMVMAGGGVSGFNGDRSLHEARWQRHDARRRHGDSEWARAGRSARRTGEKPSPEQLEQMNRTLVRNSQVEASRLMLGWFAMAHPAVHVEYTYAGEAESPDGKAYVIDVKNADTFAARLFIDEQTHLPLMVTYKGSQPRIMTAGGPGPMRQATQASGGGGHVVTRKLGEMSEEDRKKAVADAEKQIQEMHEAAAGDGGLHPVLRRLARCRRREVPVQDAPRRSAGRPARNGPSTRSRSTPRSIRSASPRRPA